MTWASMIALAFACSITVIFLLIWITFLAEKERRPAALTFVSCAPLVLLYHALWLFEFPGKPAVVIVSIVLPLIACFFLYMPWGSNPPIDVVGPQERIDERETLFHRFYRIREGTPEFDAFYADHPDKRDFDDKVRALPPLAAPGARTWHPLSSPYQIAAFSLIEDISRNIEWKPAPIEGRPVKASPEELAKRVKGFASYSGAKLVGCTRLDPAYVYSHIGRSPGKIGAPITLDHTHAVVIAVEMSLDMIRQAPDAPTTTETAFKYLEAGKVAMLVARYINLLGYEARAHVDGNYRVLCVPIAADAGIGELGRLGLLITPEYGPRIRLAVVTTDMPLAQDSPQPFGVQDFCSFCRKCADICPSGSIDKGGKQVHNGVAKWRSEQDTCYRYWRTAGSDCALCVKVCPYSHPTNVMHDSIRTILKRNRLARRVALQGDDLLYGRRPKARYPLPEWHKS
ncbi:MAG: reductive dehalogenase domain-containing protein [Planctomycetota bacterium]